MSGVSCQTTVVLPAVLGCKQQDLTLQVVPEMAEEFPDGVPLLSLLSIPVIPVQEEAAHLKEDGEGQDAANPLEVKRTPGFSCWSPKLQATSSFVLCCLASGVPSMRRLLRRAAMPLQVAVAVMTDGTVGVEVASEHAQLQWPFLSDLSMIDALIKVFQLPQHLTDAQPNTTFELGTMQVPFLAAGLQVVLQGPDVAAVLWHSLVCCFVLPAFSAVPQALVGARNTYCVSLTHI